nr:N-acetyltransferase family protein [uncultured Cohaesibacter sp.]
MSENNETVEIRNARLEDIPAIHAIYSYHVMNGLASFEETAPCVAEMGRRFAAIAKSKRPYLVATIAGQVVGYGYMSDYRTRVAYRYSLENSIYMHKDHAGKGIGLALLNRLLYEAELLGYRQVISVIGNSENIASIKLHEKAGFENVGTLKSVGFKFGRWVDSVMMQKSLGDSDKSLPDTDPTHFVRPE